VTGGATRIGSLGMINPTVNPYPAAERGAPWGDGSDEAPFLVDRTHPGILWGGAEVGRRCGELLIGGGELLTEPAQVVAGGDGFGRRRGRLGGRALTDRCGRYRAIRPLTHWIPYGRRDRSSGKQQEKEPQATERWCVNHLVHHVGLLGGTDSTA
jgi:hypothetical protein